MASFSKKQIDAVWKTAKIIKGKDPDIYRKDPYGNIIMRSKHGKETEKGWEIDHIIPVAVTERAGIDNIDEIWNLQALQSEENERQQDSPDKMTRFGVTALEYCESRDPVLAEDWEEYLLNQ